MNKIIKNLVAFAKLHSAVNEMNYYDGQNIREAIKTDLFNWFQDNTDKIIQIEKDELEKNTIGLTAKEVSVGINHGKIECIKEYRSRTGKSLLDSKKDIENHFVVNNLNFGNKMRYQDETRLCRVLRITSYFSTDDSRQTSCKEVKMKSQLIIFGEIILGRIIQNNINGCYYFHSRMKKTCCPAAEILQNNSYTSFEDCFKGVKYLIPEGCRDFIRICNESE